MLRIYSALIIPLALQAQITTHLSPHTEKAFNDYQLAAESKMDSRTRAKVAALQPGEISVTPSGGTGSIEIKNGMIHDWVASTVAPGTTVEKVLSVLQDYNNYKSLYGPEVIDARLLNHEGNRWRVYMRLVKKRVFTAVLDSEYEVEYRPLDGGRWALVSHSTKLVEIEGGKELPPGTGHGFLWRLNAYWIIEPRAEGVYLECRAISLTRDIPPGLGWAVRPIVASLPRESLKVTLEDTLRALRR